LGRDEIADDTADDEGEGRPELGGNGFAQTEEDDDADDEEAGDDSEDLDHQPVEDGLDAGCSCGVVIPEVSGIPRALVPPPPIWLPVDAA
jgi:hypothetical protein